MRRRDFTTFVGRVAAMRPGEVPAQPPACKRLHTRSARTRPHPKISTPLRQSRIWDLSDAEVVMTNFLTYRSIFVLLISGILILAVGSAKAQGHHHLPQDQGIHDRFYSNWMMPDNRTVSCCHDRDCSPAESRFEDGHWVARKIGGDGHWTVIPPEKVEHDRESPDGRSHLCSRITWVLKLGVEELVFCFIPGAGF
jgi:hypothetical protein